MRTKNTLKMFMIVGIMLLKITLMVAAEDGADLSWLEQDAETEADLSWLTEDAPNVSDATGTYMNSGETISTREWLTVAVRSDGTVVVVGDDEFGGCNVEDWTDIVAVSAGSYHIVGLRSDGTVVVDGDDSDGQCNVEDWTDIIAISADMYHTMGLRSDGTVMVAEWEYAEQLNVESWTDIMAISAGFDYAVGLRSDGTVVAEGINNDGQCDVEDWADIVAVSAGESHTVGLRSDGTVVATGRNDAGQCNVEDWTDIVAISAGGTGTVGLRSDGTVIATGYSLFNFSGDVENWTDIAAVSAGISHIVGLRSDGTVVAVGNNSFGECDVEDWTDIKLPENSSSGEPQNENIDEAGYNTADEYGLTGTYADEEENYWLQIVAEEDGSYTYKFYSADESEYNVERNCYIDGGFIYGELSSLTYNIDGTLSYSGDFTVENMEKISDDADINNDLTYDLYTDVRDALLYYNYEEDAVCDMDGEVIPEYDYITVASEENRLLINGELSDEYSLTFYDRIIYSPDAYADEGYGEEYNEESPLIEALGVSWDRCSTEYGPRQDWIGEEPVPTEIIGDGDYFDEIVLNAWYDENGVPIADYIPEDLNANFSQYGRVLLEEFHFIDNMHYTIEQIKRSGSVSILPDIYVFLFPDIQKDTTISGEQIIRGHDYFTGEEVVVHNIPNGVLNGDNLLMFTTFSGLAEDDTLNVNAFYTMINYY